MTETAVSLYGKMLAFSRLKLNTSNLEDILLAIDGLERNATVPVIIESDETLSLEALIDGLWQKDIAVIGVIDGVLNEQAHACKLAVFPSDGKRIARLSEKMPSDTSSTQTSEQPSLSKQSDEQVVMVAGMQAQSPLLADKSSQVATSDLVHTQMVRSGQALHHIGGDLVITASVNRGAEVATDYSLHIYGKGQGRLVAGATGDEQACIFCQQFDPTLVSVAGTYCLQDDIPAEMINQPVQVSFADGKLIFKRMN